MKEMRRAPRLERTSKALLSLPVAYRPCRDSGCPLDGPAPEPWQELAGRIGREVEGTVDPETLHAAAVLELVSGSPGNSLDRSISYLEMANRIEPSADKYVDLSAAYLRRARRDEDGRSIVMALDAAAEATRLDSSNAPAWFNRALALADAGLFESAESALARFTSLHPDGEWRIEADSLRDLLAVRPVVTPPRSSLTVATIATFAAVHAHDARVLAWDLLADWGRGLLKGEESDAARALALAESAGAAIEAAESDSSIGDAVRAIHRAKDAAALAKAHIAFAEADSMWRQNGDSGATRRFDLARRLGSTSRALRAWSDHGWANSRNAMDPKGTADAMRRLIDSPDATRYPALAARCYWTLGIVLVRRSETFSEGDAAIASARRLYEQLAESELLGFMTGQLGEDANLIGDTREGYRRLTEGLRIMRHHPKSNWRHNLMVILSRAATADGLSSAAGLIDAEDESAVRDGPRPWAFAENQLTRARRERASGLRTAALQSVARGSLAAARARNTRLGQDLEAELTLERIVLDSASGPATRTALDAAVARFPDTANFVKALRSRTMRAEWHMRVGDTAAAERDLETALDIYERRRASVSDPNQRALVGQQARRIVDGLTVMRLRRRDVRGALSARERSRSAVDTMALPEARNGVILELALVGDSVITLVVRGKDARVHVGGNRSRILEQIELANAALERGAAVPSYETALDSLYDAIVAPIETFLFPTDSLLTVITDPALSRAPFPALRNRRTGRYLVQDRAIRFVSSIAQANRRAIALPTKPRALFVAAPEVDRRIYPGLSSLPWASREVDSIARTFSDTVVLRGPEVDTSRMKHALSRVQLLHFAGHALFDDARPHQSLLVIGARGITARSIAAMRLPGLRLAVLSACETTRSPAAEGAGFLGLSDSFMAAGAGGVVGSTWKVNDAATMQLMRQFYAALETRSPAQALAAAQRLMVSQSPSSWAGFRYAGE
jgi:CHAT domain-containing protein